LSEKYALTFSRRLYPEAITSLYAPVDLIAIKSPLLFQDNTEIGIHILIKDIPNRFPENILLNL
jgi:hypothetical protein